MVSKERLTASINTKKLLFAVIENYEESYVFIIHPVLINLEKINELGEKEANKNIRHVNSRGLHRIIIVLS